MRFFSQEKCLLFLDAAPGRLDRSFATLSLEGARSSQKETHQGLPGNCHSCVASATVSWRMLCRSYSKMSFAGIGLALARGLVLTLVVQSGGFDVNLSGFVDSGLAKLLVVPPWRILSAISSHRQMVSKGIL